MSRYAPALIQLAIALTGALAQMTGRITLVTALQLAVLAANAVAVYLVPLFGPAARSGWKTGVAVLGALVTAFIPVWLTGHITGAQIALVILAGLQALGAHIGVQIRKTVPTGKATIDTVTLTGKPPTQEQIAFIRNASEPPTDTTLNTAITNGGEFLGEPAR